MAKVRYSSLNLVFILLFSLCTLCLGQEPQFNDLHCHMEELPSNLNSLSYLELNGEFHSFGKYFEDFTEHEKVINFTLSQQSAFRIYVAPHDADVDLWLYNSSDLAIAHSSLDVGTEEVIQANLIPGTYFLKLTYFGVWIGHYQAQDCDAIVMQLEIVPTAVVRNRFSQFSCPTSETLPTPLFGPLATGGTVGYRSDYDQAGTTMVVKGSLPTGNTETRWIIGYNFTIPNGEATSTIWKIDAMIGSEFIFGGSLGLLLIPQNQSPSLACISEGNCTVSYYTRQNENSLKTIITSGSYTLWIFDRISERNFDLAPCIPFSLNLNITNQLVKESFITCEALQLPEILNLESFEQPSGTFHFREAVLVELEKNEHMVNFTVATESYFRVAVSPHRVDIDLKLFASNGTMLAYSGRWGGEDAIAYFLPAGKYYITIIYYGINEPRFCETFDVEIALAPKSQFPNFNYCLSGGQVKNIKPNLSGLNTLVNSTFILNNSTFYYFPSNGNSNQKVLQQNFVISQESVFNAELGYNFLLNDMEISLINSDTSTTFYGHHRRNFASLLLTLVPGNYSLVIETGVTASSLRGFPNCSEYTFMLKIQPKSAAGPCWSHLRIPSTLNTPQYLGNHGVVHFIENFLAPVNGFSTPEKIFFNVSTESVFRVWTEQHILDIDFYLYENGIYCSRSDSFFDEEEIVWSLQPNKSYELTIIYYHYTPSDPHTVEPDCWIFKLELDIAPITPGSTCQNSLPPVNLIPNYSSAANNSFYSKGRFTLNQRPTNFVHRMPFSVSEDTIFFRAVIYYDFLYSDFSLRLLVNNNTESTPYGKGEYNRNNLGTLLLGPGDYILEIYEPARMIREELRRCVQFNLEVGYLLSSVPTGDTNSLLGCSDTYFPSSLNTQSYLSVLSNQVHFLTNILVNVKTKRDAFRFTLTETSIFRLFVPKHEVVDVDFILYPGNDDSSTAIVRNTGTNEESILVKLNPGSYYMKVVYYSYPQTTLPPPSQCLTFPIELSITPTSYLDSIPQLLTPCTTQVPPTQMQSNRPFSGIYSRSLSQTFNTFLTFNLANPAILEIDLRYNFPSGDLALDLNGTVTQGLITTRKVFYHEMGYNSAFFRKAIPAGQYNLTIHDPYPNFLSTLDPTLRCSQYFFSYFINENSSLIDDCSVITQSLPTDLFSVEGGSIPYGGPQNPTDGSVRIFGEEFFLTTTPTKDNFILFKVPVDSFVRVFAKTSQGSDVDFFMYKNSSRAPGTLVPDGTSIGMDTMESNLVRLPSQNEPYMLDVYIFRVAPHEQGVCPTFYFEFALKPVTTVQQEVACPAVLPSPEVPPDYLDLTTPQWVYLEDLYFTKSRIDANTHQGMFTYRITLSIPVNATLFIAIGFDFLVNDFRLVLRDANDIFGEIAHGDSSGTENRDDIYNFYNLLYAEVEPGRYYLDIIEDVSSKNLGVTEYCHQFSFFFASFSESAPTVDFVMPPSGTEIDPTKDLTITISFSTEVADLNSFGLVDYLRSHKIISLVPVGGGTTLYPNAATLDSTKTVLEVMFLHSSFSVGKSYELVINASQLHDSQGRPFVAPTEKFTYSMISCNCNNRGTCNSNTLVCTCNSSYSGDQCQYCAVGYHWSTTECVKNVACKPNTCNGHGTCDDSRGYPICFCDPGFGTVGNNFCQTCAVGFSGYPNCTSNSQEGEKPTRCTTTLIPDNLDSIAFLGYNGATHLQGDYYIDTDNLKHDVMFTITQPSVFRAYSEPHWIDIDMYLYVVDSNGVVQRTVDFGIAIGLEEELFDVINGSIQNPVYYMLRFRYYIWERDHVVNCEHFNLELEIMPLARAEVESRKMSPSCGNGLLPNPPAIGSNSQPYLYQPTDEFSVLARPNAPKSANYFWSWNFTVVNPPGKAAILTAHIGYKFALGDLNLMLQTSESRQPHCGRDGGSHPACTSGSNIFNGNRIHETLGNGDYTLWIYEPRPQNSNLTQCSKFTFQTEIKYVDLSEDIFYCDARLFPKSFNVPGYFDRRGYAHVNERFLINDANTFFTVSVDSVMRVRGVADSSLSWSLVDASTNATLQTSVYSKNSHLFAVLSAGRSYYLRISSFSTTSYCPMVDVELEISPNSLLPHSCPGNERLPSLGPITVPFSFPATASSVPVTYYAYTNNDVILQWSFTVDQVSVLETAVDSDFLTGALQMQLEFTEQIGRRRMFGIDTYHQSLLREVLDPGQYVLKLVRPDQRQQNPNNFPPCTAFNFYLKLNTIAGETSCASSGLPLPTTFNSIRFLGTDNQFDFGSPAFRIPDFNFYYSHPISVNVNVPSVIRVYTQPYIVDIDCALYREDNQMEPLASGNFTFNEEESFVYVLQPNQNYVLKLLFWKWDASAIPQCPVFNMEVAIVPVNLVTPTQTQCGSFSSHWPSGPSSTLNLPSAGYHYNSVAIGESLYYQQSVELARSQPINFKLTSPANLHAELGYNFISGDLLMQLSNADTQEVFWGVNLLNGNVLNLVGLSPGNYTLIFEEVTTNIGAYMGCSYFTFELQIDPAKKLTRSYHPLPTSLNTISYLKYSDAVHITGSYLLFADSNSENISFTISQESLMRVSTDHYIDNEDSIQLVLTKDGSAFAGFYETLIEVLPPGIYVLAFNKPYRSSIQGNFVVEIQLAITPSTQLQQDIQNMKLLPNCTEKVISPVVLNPVGSYQFNSDNLQFSQSSLKSKLNLQNLNFAISKPSVFYAKIGYPFLINDMELSVSGQKQSGQSIKVFGRNSRNQNEINEILPEGNYTLTISQEVKFDFPGSDKFSHCGRFSARVLIQDAANETTHTDCTTLDLVPWDLNDKNGGSSNFGGPIGPSGRLHLMGETFMIPLVLGQIDTMRLNISETSLISVITAQRFMGDISYTFKSGNSNLLTPLTSVSDYNGRAEIFDLRMDSNVKTTNFSLDLRYNIPGRTQCRYFGLQMVIRPLSQVAQSISCPQQIMERLPQTSVKPNSRGIYAEYLPAYFTHNTLSRNGTKFLHEIKIQITNSSLIIANFGFNSLVNMFQMKLLAQSYLGVSRYEIGRSTFKMQAAQTGETNAALLLSGTFYPGTYFLQIIQNNFQLPLMSSINQPRCFPFIYDLQIVPNNGLPYIPTISPPAGNLMSPADPIELEVTFSKPLYYNRAPVTNGDPLMHSLYLADQSSTSIKINPSSAYSEVGNTWHVVFSPPFTSKASYKLGLTDGILTDANGVSVQLISTNIFSMIDTTCNGKGTFDRGYCFCNIGYGGDECTTCDLGYKNTGSGGSLVCERQIDSLCVESSCGCAPGITPCEPLGLCDSSSGKIVCSCFGHYSGANCSECASGYTNWKAGCIPVQDGCPTCQHGNCDTATKTCICDTHFKGKTCDECDDGWSGTNCNTPVITPKPTSNGAVKTVALTALSVISIIIVLAMIAGTAALLLYKKFVSQRNYSQLELNSLEDD